MIDPVINVLQITLIQHDSIRVKRAILMKTLAGTPAEITDKTSVIEIKVELRKIELNSKIIKGLHSHEHTSETGYKNIIQR